MSVNQQSSKLNAESFRDLHCTYWNRLLLSVTGMVRDKTKAEDITAAAFQSAWENRETFRGESSPYTWLYAIAFNEARQFWRRKPVLESIDRLDTGELAEAGLITDALEQQDGIERIHRALQRIPAKHRRVLLDHFAHGFSVKRIARREGIARGTVLSRIFNGKRLLRRAWEAQS